jgi:hypothetical protein
MNSAHIRFGLFMVLVSTASYALAATLADHQERATTGSYTFRNGYTGDLTLLARAEPRMQGVQSRTPLFPALVKFPSIVANLNREETLLRFDTRLPAALESLPLLSVPAAKVRDPAFYVLPLPNRK